MKFSSYVFEKLHLVLLYSLFLIFFALFLFLSDSSFAFIMVMVSSGVLLGIITLYISYNKYKKRIEDLKKTISKMDEKYLIGEVMSPPSDLISYEYYLLMKEISSSAISVIKEKEKESKNYRDYIENWVHEIKTPLSALSLILDNGGDKSKLKREIKNAENITETVLSLSRLDNIHQDKNIKKTDIRAMVEDALRDEMTLLIAKSNRIEIKGEGEAYTDHILFTSILRQLLVNASKYAPTSLLTFTIRDNYLSLKDEGPGISKNEIRRVTEKGYVGEKWRGKNGSGMGLYIVKKISQSLAIDFSIESEEGKGTVFIFHFSNSNLTEM